MSSGETRRQAQAQWIPSTRDQCTLKLIEYLGEKLDVRFDWLGNEPLRNALTRNVLYIRDKNGALRELVPNRAQAEFAARCTRRNIVLKARQLGITTYIASRFFLHTITHPGTVTVQVAHDQESAEEIFRIVHRYLENLPEWLRSGALRPSRANVRQLVFPRLDSEYRVETAADPQAGRGLTIHNLHCSEVARWPGDAAAILAGLRAAVPPQGEVVLESTANGAGGCFYDEWQHAGETGYTRHFFPWWWEPAYAREGVRVQPLTQEEAELVQRFGLRDAQIAFRREIRANFRGLAPQEFAEDANACFLASGECVFDVDLVQRRLTECPPAQEARDNGRLQIWLPPRHAREYIVAVDPAGGGSEGDYACAEVIERVTGMQCAELHGHWPPPELAIKVAALGSEYNDALVAVERNNHGHAVLAHLEFEQYSNLYEQDGQSGWLTTTASRPRMLENFAAVLTSAPRLFNSEPLLAECRSFVRHSDGRSAATSGAHDDRVMAMAIALAVRAELGGRGTRKGAVEFSVLG